MVGGFALTRFIFVVDGGERALKYDKIRGVQPHIYGEGMHFYIPIFQVNKLVNLNVHLIFRNLKSSRLGLDLS
jgi:hypothetical protein